MANSAKKQKVVQSEVYTISTQNKFNILSDLENKLDDQNMEIVEPSQSASASETNSGAQNAQQGSAKVKITPIVVTATIENYTTCIDDIIKNIKFKPRTSYSARNGLKIFVDNLDDYKKLKNDFFEQRIPFYTYAFKNEKDVHQVIKGLPKIDTEIIKKEINNSGLKCKRVIQMKQRQFKDNRPINPIYLATFESDTNINEIRKIKSIYYVNVHWEKYYHKSEVTQCHRCQEFGHGSNSCFQDPKCVKCNGNHITEQCGKTTEEKPYCVNCGDEHRANSRFCPVYQRRINLIHENRQKLKGNSARDSKANFIINPKQFPALPSNNYNSATKQTGNEPTLNSWSQVAGNNADTINNFNKIHEFLALFNEIEKLNKICNISELLTTVRTMNQQLSNTQNKTEQMAIIFNTLKNGSK